MTKFQTLVRRRKLEDRLFNLLGVLSLIFCLATLGILIADLIIDGLARIDWQFLSSFPSRRAERAGILSAIVGSIAVMIVTVLTAVPLGVAAGIYLEEYGK